MIVSDYRTFQYRSIVRFHSFKERVAIVEHLKRRKGKVGVYDNPSFPYPPIQKGLKYGLLMIDFQSKEDQATFDKLCSKQIFHTPAKRVSKKTAPILTVVADSRRA